MESLPIDTSHPAVRDYLSLIRLQVLTPLSLLINIASVVVCAGISTPSLAGISRLHPTSITPHSGALSTYVGTIFLTQIGYCLILVVTRNAETKKTLVKGVGFSLVFANICMAVWAIAFVMQWFLFSTVLQGLIILALFYSNIALLVYHPPIGWLDTALIHAPMRFFFVLPFAILMPLCLFITLGLTYSPPYPDGPQDYTKWHAWTGFGVIMGTNTVAFLVILLRRDIVWCIAATWICISIWSKKPKPGPVYITVIIFTVLHPLALLSGYVYHLFFKKQGAVIQLPVDEEHPDPYVAGQPGQTASTTSAGNQYQNTAPPANGVKGVPREIDEDATWG